MNKNKKELMRLADELVEDLLKATDEEIMSDAIEDGFDVAQAVSSVSEIIEKNRFLKAQETLKKEKNVIIQYPARKDKVIDIEEARKRIRRAYDENPSYMMAARFGESIPDDDVIDMYKQMVKHGLIDKDNCNDNDES
jgi:poly(3-hydroxyalkanoate) synthetase